MQRINLLKILTLLVFMVTISVNAQHDSTDVSNEKHQEPAKDLKTEIKEELIDDFKKTWMAKANDNAIFISAQNKENIMAFRKLIYDQVKVLYLERYPYKASYIENYDYEGFGEEE